MPAAGHLENEQRSRRAGMPGVGSLVSVGLEIGRRPCPLAPPTQRRLLGDPRPPPEILRRPGCPSPRPCVCPGGGGGAARLEGALARRSGAAGAAVTSTSAGGEGAGRGGRRRPVR